MPKLTHFFAPPHIHRWFKVRGRSCHQFGGGALIWWETTLSPTKTASNARFHTIVRSDGFGVHHRHASAPQSSFYSESAYIFCGGSIGDMMGKGDEACGSA